MSSFAAARGGFRRDGLLLTAAFLSAWLGFAFFRAFMSGDGFFSLAAGQLVLDTGALPGRDPFAYGSTSDRWILHFPLVQLGFALLHHLGGLFAVTVAAALAGAVAFTALTRSAGARLVACLIAAVPILWLAFFDRATFETRPQAFATNLLVVMFFLVERLRRGRAVHPFAFVVLGCAWVNIHPSFVTAVGWPLIALVASRFDPTPPTPWPFLVAAAGTAIGAMVSPYGPLLFLDDLRMMGMSSTAHINHFLPPDLRDPLTFVGMAGLLALVALHARSPIRARAASNAILLACLVAASVTSQRFILLAVCFAIVISGPQIRHVARGLRVPRPAALAVAGAVAIAGVAVGSTPRDPLTDVPVAEVNCIDELDLGERVMTLWAWGGYLDWRWQGRRKPLADGRTQIFPESLFFDHLQITYAEPGALRLLDLYEVDVVLVNKRTPLGPLLLQTPTWERVCQAQGKHLVFRRAHLAASPEPTAPTTAEPDPEAYEAR